MTLSPKTAHFNRLNKFIHDHHYKYSLLVVSVDRDEDTEEYTAAEIAKLRHILINDSRDKALTKAEEFTTCGGKMMFGKSEGNLICMGIPDEIKKALRKKSIPARFDHLLALTDGLDEFDYWMYANECYEPGEELEQAIKALAKAWRNMLKHSNEELGIDGEYTRPGIEALLSTLEDDFRACELTEIFPFEWRD